MSKKRYIKNNSKYVLKKFITQDTGVKYFEADHLTTTKNKGGDMYLPINLNDRTKKYNFGNWIAADIISGATQSTSSLNTSNEIILNPDNTKITTYCYYGNAVELAKNSITNILSIFPGEIFLPVGPVYEVLYYDADNNEVPIKDNNDIILYRVSNPFNINIKSTNSIGVENVLRSFSLSIDDYVILNENNVIIDDNFTWSGLTNISTNVCPANGELLYTIPLTSAITISVFNVDGEEVFMHNSDIEIHIRPKDDIVKSVLNGVTGFDYNMINPNTEPKYTMVLENRTETEEGVELSLKKYTWPTSVGDWNLDFESYKYQSYVSNLIEVLSTFDEKYTDNLWRMLCHESIKNLDGDEDSAIEGISKLRDLLKIYGKNFDDIKLYIDNIKFAHTVTYDDFNNAPDYMLSDLLTTKGWDVGDIFLDKSIIIDEPIYSGWSQLYNYSDANQMFMKQLKLCGSYIQSCRGTKKSIDMVMALFGIDVCDYEINEYVDVAVSGYTNYEKTIGYNKIFCDLNNLNYEVFTDGFYGLQTKGVSITSGDTTSKYIIPWFPKKTYDSAYFQMKGGWGYSNTKYVNYIKSNNVRKINSSTDFGLFDEADTQIFYAKKLTKLVQETIMENGSIYYVNDISDLGDIYSGLLAGYTPSNYFVLKNNTSQNTIGFDTDNNEFGWKVVYKELLSGEIDTEHVLDISGETMDASRVLYANNIKNNENPHIGLLKYDRGEEFYDGYKELFKYYLNDYKYLVPFSDDEIDDIKTLGFKLNKYIDNKKCWYFTDTSNDKLSEFNPIDGTFFYKKDGDLILDDTLDVGPDYDYKITINTSNYDNSQYLEFKSGDTNIRTIELVPYNPETSGNTKNNDVAASYSVINDKRLVFKSNRKDDNEFTNYLVNNVLPFIKQIIPSTTLLEFDIYSTIQSETTSIELSPVKQFEYISIWSEYELTTDYVNDYVNIQYQGIYDNNYIFLIEVSGKITTDMDTEIIFKDVNDDNYTVTCNIKKFPYVGTFIVGDGTKVSDMNI